MSTHGDTGGENGGPRLTRRGALLASGATLAALGVGATSLAGAQQDGSRSYRVTVANLTRGQPFTPPLVAVHRPSVELFAVGDPATPQLQQLAENGDLAPLVELAEGSNAVRGAVVGDAPLVPEADPADTGNPYYAELTVSTDGAAGFLSFASMLIATNDGVVGLDTVRLPAAVNQSVTYYANGYDVGTEQNTELFQDLVPPAKTLILGGEPEGTTDTDPALAEDGVVRPHPAIQGDGDLPPAVYDWREPAALVQVERLDTGGGPA